MLHVDFFKRYKIFENETLQDISPLEFQGFSNTNYLLTTSTNNYIIRVFKEEMDRKFEFKMQLKAYKKGFAPKPLLLDEKNSLMISHYQEGSHKKSHHKKDIKTLAHVVQKIHKFKTYNKFHTLHKIFVATLRKNKNSNIKQVLKNLVQFKKDYVLCHNDLNPKNIIYSSDIKIIDWEFTGINDRYFELATLIVEHNFNKKNEQYFLQCYFKTGSKFDAKKLYTYKILYLSFCAHWFAKKDYNLEKLECLKKRDKLLKTKGHF